MLKPSEHDRGQQGERLAVCLRDEKGHDRELGDVELQLAHGALEARGRGRDVREIESHDIRRHVTGLQRARDGIRPEQRGQDHRLAQAAPPAICGITNTSLSGPISWNIASW